MSWLLILTLVVSEHPVIKTIPFESEDLARKAGEAWAREVNRGVRMPFSGGTFVCVKTQEELIYLSQAPKSDE